MDKQGVTADEAPETTHEYRPRTNEKPDPNLGVENQPGGMFEEVGQNEEEDDGDYEGQDDGVGDEDEQEEEDAPVGPLHGGIYDQQQDGQLASNDSQQLMDGEDQIDEDEELKMKIVLYYHTLVSNAA